MATWLFLVDLSELPPMSSSIVEGLGVEQVFPSTRSKFEDGLHLDLSSGRLTKVRIQKEVALLPRRLLLPVHLLSLLSSCNFNYYVETPNFQTTSTFSNAWLGYFDNSGNESYRRCTGCEIDALGVLHGAGRSTPIF